MTDLERLWDDYPAGKAPTTDIVRAGRKASGRAASGRHLFTRPLIAAGVATGLLGAFLVGTTVGNNGGGPGGMEALPSHVAFRADLSAAEDCDELLDAYIDRALPLVTPWGWGHPVDLHRAVLDDMPEGGGWEADGAITNEMPASASADTAKVQRQTSSETGTNVQEVGVDEPDGVKTDGEVLARVRDDKLSVYDVSGDDVAREGSLRLDGIEEAELMLAGETLIAVGTDETAKDQRGTRVLQISLADPGSPEVVADVSYDAVLLSARRHDAVVRLVMSSGLPDLDFVDPDGKRGDNAALKENRALVRESAIEDWLPEITTEAGSGQLLDCTDVAIPDDELGLDTVSVVGFSADDPASVRAIGLAGATDIAYESADHLYLVASPAWTRRGCCFDDLAGRRPVHSGVTGGTSYLFDFELDGIEATHVASGEVEGAIADRWSMDEQDGVMRVAVGPTEETGNFNSVVTLERDGEELLELGRIDEIGPREDIKSVRWMDDLAIVVTFRQVDPLYAIDLTDDAAPELLGELKIPGFSSYLHPLGGKRMLGVGEGPVPTGKGWGAQVGFFDVTDLTDVQQIDVLNYGRDTRAVAAGDPRAFTWLPGDRTVLTVIDGREDGSRVGWVSVLKLSGGELHNQMVQVEYGSDVDHVRTVPLPDGRVVLVTGEDAEFFDLHAR